VPDAAADGKGGTRGKRERGGCRPCFRPAKKARSTFGQNCAFIKDWRVFYMTRGARAFGRARARRVLFFPPSPPPASRLAAGGGHERALAPPLFLLLTHHDAFLTPGTIPSVARRRSMMRLSRNAEKTPLPRPVSAQRLRTRTGALSRGSAVSKARPACCRTL